MSGPVVPASVRPRSPFPVPERRRHERRTDWTLEGLTTGGRDAVDSGRVHVVRNLETEVSRDRVRSDFPPLLGNR